MKSLNRVYLVGHLGHSPELKVSKNGQNYAHLSLATNRRWRDGEDWQERTDWHSITVWGREAEHCCQNLQKGNPVFVEGSLSYFTPKIENGEANESATKTIVKADKVRFFKTTDSSLSLQ